MTRSRHRKIQAQPKNNALLQTNLMSYFRLAPIICLFQLNCSPSVRYAAEDDRPVLRSQKNFRQAKVLEGNASYYGKKFHGRKTANGEVFDMYKKTAAHRELPFETMLKVTNKSNNRSVIVRVNDRGPFKEGRILDLSYGAAREIDMIGDGVAEVRIEILRLGNGD